MRNYLKRAVPKAPQNRRNLENTVRDMLDEIRVNKDAAVTEYAKNLDKWSRGSFLVTQDEIRKVGSLLPDSFKQDFAYCKNQVIEFAKRQLESLHSFESEVAPGVILGQKNIPISRVGCYVPGGKYPLISSAIMSVSTARVAGVSHITACAPPRDSGGMYPHTVSCQTLLNKILRIVKTRLLNLQSVSLRVSIALNQKLLQVLFWVKKTFLFRGSVVMFRAVNIL